MRRTDSLIKDPDAGKDWKQEGKGATEDELVGWHHRLDGHEFEQALGVGDGQGGLVCFSPWGRKESDSTEQMNGTELTVTQSITWTPGGSKRCIPIRTSLQVIDTYKYSIPTVTKPLL